MSSFSVKGLQKPTSLFQRLHDVGQHEPRPIFPRPVLISEPCMGAATVSEAMHNWDVTYSPVNVYDKLGGLESFHNFLFGDLSLTFMLGPREGDLLKKALVGLKDSDGLISGPPCPPWSTSGTQGGASDPRARVFDRVIQWIIELAIRGLLLYFAIENVPGILKQLAIQDNLAYMTILVDKLHAKIPFFQTWYRKLNESDTNIQSRERVWLLGLRKDVLKDESPPEPLAVGALEALQLEHVLDPDLPNMEASDLPGNGSMARNLRHYTEKIKAVVQADPRNMRLAIFDVDRSFDRTWSTRVMYDRVPTLTTKNRYLFLLSVTDLDLPPKDKMFHRLLHSKERFVIQGRDPSLVNHVSTALATKLTGNAFPVGMCERVVMPLLQRISKSQIIGKDPRSHKLNQKALTDLAARYPFVDPHPGRVASEPSNKRPRHA